jgi:E3 ubiquitin-protein ligase CCNP1IP1
VLAAERWLKLPSVYQEYLAKTLTDKYSNLNQQLDKVLNDANSELNILNQRINSMPTDA